MNRMPDLSMSPNPELWQLIQRLHAVSGLNELRFLWLNETRALFAYRQSALLDENCHVVALSGVGRIDRNTPYAAWLERIAGALPARTGCFRLTVQDVPLSDREQWNEFWPAHALVLRTGTGVTCLMATEVDWTAEEIAVLEQWWDLWNRHRSLLETPAGSGFKSLATRIKKGLRVRPEKRWWQQPATMLLAGFLIFCALPVRLSVLAPGELVPVNPVWIRSPIEGVIDTLHVQPNQLVAKGTALLGFDEILIQSRLDVALQALATAEAEYRQASQLALGDNKYKSQMALLIGKIEEKRSEADFHAAQRERARVMSPIEGTVLMDDPSEWIGKPVAIGERILRIAGTGDTEIEVWLPIGDAIALKEGDAVSLHLNASPLSPVEARVRYMAHDAVIRPDGQFAYRVRASLDEPTAHRIGLKGTAKVSGERVPLLYWILRRPLASLRAFIGI